MEEWICEAAEENRRR